MQAQDYGPAKWSVGQRATGLRDRDVDAAVAEGSIVRTHVLRPTWHFVAREDVRWMLALTGPRIQAGSARRYQELGLDPGTLARCETAIASALRGRNQLTRNELAAALKGAGIDPSGQRVPHVLAHCEMEGLITSGGRSGKQHAYALLDERVPPLGRFDRRDALAELIRRHLRSRGPATVRDVSWWSGLRVADVRDALRDLGEEVSSEEVEGLTFWSLAADPGPARGGPRGHLLQTYDELLVGYTESRYFADPLRDAARAVWGSRGLPSAVALVDGRVAGHWRRSLNRESVEVEVLLYDEPSTSACRAVGAAAGRLGHFLELPVRVRISRL